MFKIPIENLKTCPYSNIFNRSQRAELNQNADLITCGAAPHRFTVEALNNTSKDLMSNESPLGSKNIIFARDF